MTQTRWRRLILILAAGAATACSVQAASTAPAAEAGRVASIRIERSNVFEENATGFYRFANRIHFVTREEVVRRELLFREGDALDPARLAETERVLRAKPLFRRVSVSTSAAPGGADVLVRTSDAWTTTARATYGLAGGRSSYGLGAQERNLFGTGRVAGAFVERNVDRTTRGVLYRDDRLLGSPLRFDAGYGRDEKGREYALGVEKPFRSLYDRFSAGVELGVRGDEERLFRDGETAARFQRATHRLRAASAMRIGGRAESVPRVGVAAERRNEDFSDPRGTLTAAPADVRIRAALLTFEWRQNRFAREVGVFSIDREEDIGLGWGVLAEAGVSPRAWGASSNSIPAALSVEKGWLLGRRRYAAASWEASGRRESRGWVDGRHRATIEGALADWRPGDTFLMRLHVDARHRPTDLAQSILGGENGLRGYSVRQFAGAKKWVATAENRRLIKRDWLNLASVAWAAFIDAGAVAGPGRSLFSGEVRGDAGLGLRFGLTRSVEKVVIRADIAYAFSGNRRSSRAVLSIGGTARFGDFRRPKFVRS